MIGGKHTLSKFQHKKAESPFAKESFGFHFIGLEGAENLSLLC